MAPDHAVKRFRKWIFRKLCYCYPSCISSSTYVPARGDHIHNNNESFQAVQVKQPQLRVTILPDQLHKLLVKRSTSAEQAADINEDKILVEHPESHSPVPPTSTCTWEAAGVVVPGIPNEVALRILARVPRVFHVDIRRVCRTWREALQPHVVTSVRKILKVSETWNLLYRYNGRDIAVVDLYHNLLHPIASITLPNRTEGGDPTQIYFLGAAHSEFVFTLHQKGSLKFVGLYTFDAASMQWHERNSAPWPFHHLPRYLRSTIINHAHGRYLRSTIIDHGHGRYLYVLNNANNVWRLNFKSNSWEVLPNMHKERYGAIVVLLQGHLCVLGGMATAVPDGIRSGVTPATVNSGEIWDENSREWTLVPELWPAHLFRVVSHINYERPNEVAVVMGRLYAISRRAGGWGEIMYFDNSSKCWNSLGSIPAYPEPIFPCSTLEYWYELLGVGQELWVVSYDRKICFATVPSLSKRPLLWRPILSSPLLNDTKGDQTHLCIIDTCVHV